MGIPSIGYAKRAEGAARGADHVPARLGVVVADGLHVPPEVNDLAAFRAWVCAPDFPERARVSYFSGEIWVDTSMERSIHNRLKTRVGTCLDDLAEREQRGLYFSDGMLLTNVDAELATQPDGMYVSTATLASGRVQLQEGDAALEIVRSPDMTLEIVSPTSARKDLVVLPLRYWKAGITEYWRIDSRAKIPHLEILRRGRTKYQAVRSVGGWVKSAVFGKAFRLMQRQVAPGLSQFTLESR